jgi:vacuolar-type H+-ATPase subunit I/STV1
MVPRHVIDRGYYITGSTVNATGGTDMDPETDEKFAQLESSLSLEQQRLEKLWDAYEQQEKDLNAALDRINFLEADIETKETMIASLQELLTERDTKITELEVERQRQSKVEAEYEPRIQAMDTTMNDQTEKYDRLLSITQEMEDELDLARRSLHARDGWFNANVSSLETISEVIKEWRNIQAGKFPDVKEASGPGGGKNEFIAAISKIKGLGAMKAENLYDSGFHTVEDLKAANIDDVASVVGFTKLSASKAVNGVKDL